MKWQKKSQLWLKAPQLCLSKNMNKQTLILLSKSVQDNPLVIGVDAAAGHVLDQLVILGLVSNGEEDVQQQLLGQLPDPGLQGNLDARDHLQCEYWLAGSLPWRSI